MLKKLYLYYRYNGLKQTIKAILKKIFRKNKVTSGYLEKYKNFDYSEENKDNQDIILKDTRKVFIFATVPYFDVGGGQRSSQLAKTFNKLGYEIHYIYYYHCSEENIPIMSMPLALHQHIDQVDKNILESRVTDKDFFIFELPTCKFDEFLKIAKRKSAKVIYENIDNWESALVDISGIINEDSIKLFLKESDILTSTAHKLVDQTKEYLKRYDIKDKEVYYIPNAVDDEIFEPRKNYQKPNDLVTNEITLLYYGSLWGKWFDWDIIKKVADSSAYISINLIGDYNAVRQKVQEMPNNVHFLGLKRQDELPAYLQHADYAILPFKPGDISDYVSPIKIFEYISMNKKILATSLPDIIGYPNVFTSEKSEDWIRHIEENKEEADIFARDKFINDNTWNSRCAKMLDLLYPENKEKIEDDFYEKISVIILNYNNKNVIFKCIDTLLMNNERYKYQIVVVDNQSKDGSYEILQEKYADKITLVRNEKNGCSSGRNLGVKQATGEYIVFLDSDQWITNHYWLDHYLGLMKKNNNIGSIGWGAGWFNKKGYSYMVVDGYEHRYMPPNAAARKDIGYLATCGFLMKKQLFDEIGGFDLAYDPTCYEDTDLSLSIRNKGLEIYYSPYLGVGHLPHQTTKSGTDDHTELSIKKGDYFIEKWTKIDSNLIFNYVR